MELDRLEGWWGEKGGEVIYTKTGYKPDNFTICSPSLGNKLCTLLRTTYLVYRRIKKVNQRYLLSHIVFENIKRIKDYVGGMLATTSLVLWP